MLMPSSDDTTQPGAGGLEALFQQYYGLVLSAALRVTGNRQDAEDVLQTVFLRLAKRWDEIDLSDTVGSYLHRAAVNAAIDLLRSRARAGAIPLDDPGAPELPDAEGVSPERRQQDREFRRELRTAVLSLPERHADMFILRYFEDLPNKEIARMLDVTQTTVAVTLHRARKRLQSDLQQFVRGEAS